LLLLKTNHDLMTYVGSIKKDKKQVAYYWKMLVGAKRNNI